MTHPFALLSYHLVTLSSAALAVAQERRYIKVVAAGERRRGARRLERLSLRLGRLLGRRDRDRLRLGDWLRLVAVGRAGDRRRVGARALDVRAGHVEAGSDQRDPHLALREAWVDH